MPEPLPLFADVWTWSTIWLWVLILGGAAFLVILAYSVICGAADIRDLFSALSVQEGEAHHIDSAADAGQENPQTLEEPQQGDVI